MKASGSKIPISQLQLISTEDSFKNYPLYDEITNPVDLIDTKLIKKRLDGIDWSFKDENTTFLSHNIHPYPAKFIPQIPGNLIARLSLPGEVVLDPFAGCCTTALEALRLGRRAKCIDANLIGILIGRVKTTLLGDLAIQDINAIKSCLISYIDIAQNNSSELQNKFASLIPKIPNREKWFPNNVSGELALIKSTVEKTESEAAKNIAKLALSKTILSVSFQDSETRYASKPREISDGDAIRQYLKALEFIVTDVANLPSALQYGIADFHVEDTRYLNPEQYPDESVDLIITSPPYGNAMDYHLYHRFRLFWLGADPKQLSQIEIGSHLRHQRESSGFKDYIDDLMLSFQHLYRMLKPGRYAAFVIGDSIYNNKTYDGRSAVYSLARKVGFETIWNYKRELPKHKRSFLAAGRRATSESIVLLRKPIANCKAFLSLPPYRLWPYENKLRVREINTSCGRRVKENNAKQHVEVDPVQRYNLRRLAFTNEIKYKNGITEKTWQTILENGNKSITSSRKNPKYLTHGIHQYKGKFYPQLAKALINIANVPPSASILDPFCGSGTTLLEAYLNGYKAYGCDLNPMAAKITRAKVGVLSLDPLVVRNATANLQAKIIGFTGSYPQEMDEFDQSTHEEIRSWFPEPAIYKINWILREIRALSAGILRDYFEIILSSIIRNASQQEPRDLRIRRRKEPLVDSDVIGLFMDALVLQHNKLEKYWCNRGYSPFKLYPAKAKEGDARNWEIYKMLGLNENTVDLVITSPPYATALPYIDTDRLSILTLCGINSQSRRPIEQNLTGSREIIQHDKLQIEKKIHSSDVIDIPLAVHRFIKKLSMEISKNDVGFRRKNLPSLLYRFFKDLSEIFSHLFRLMKPSGIAMIVLGDNSTKIGETTIAIPTVKLSLDIALELGFNFLEKLPIDVTTENMLHIKNAIKENAVLILKK